MARHKMTVSTQATSHRLSSAERHAAEIMRLSSQQAELKREASDRRAERAIKRARDAATTRGV
jgi:hypothetical protein